MNRQDAEQIISENLKPIFGFALKRCRNIHDAEDLSQDIALNAFRALLVRDDIADTGKYIWTIAHNALSNYYRDMANGVIGVSIDEIEEFAAPDSLTDGCDDTDTICRLQSEIAYLSKLQRKIVIAYYFENRRQTDIARKLDIPLGTVKWHLFEAKKELKRGMDTMRNSSELKFNPIKFQTYGISGSVGTKKPDEFFRSALTQNICYCVRNEAKSINRIADDLGVSPVYVESEVDFLEMYGFLKEEKGKYIVNFMICELTEELLTMQDSMYKEAAGLFANELYDELIGSGLLDDERILCNQMLSGSTCEKPLRDKNFLLWSLIPYIAACSGESLIDDTVSFDEAATIRPDGGHNICYADVVPDNLSLPRDYVSMKNWCGPIWNQSGDSILWQIDSEWSDRNKEERSHYPEDAQRILSLYKHESECPLTEDDYAWLSEKGYIRMTGDYNGDFSSVWKITVLGNKEIRDELLAVGEKLKLKYKDKFAEIKAPYVKAMLDTVPAHLRRVMAYTLQFVFHSDGWFLLHCITALLGNGKLKPPAEEQRKALTTLILQN